MPSGGIPGSKGGKDPAAPFVMGRREPVLSAWVAEECNRVLGGELTEERGRLRAVLVGRTKKRKLDSRNRYKVFPPVKMGAQAEDVADTPWTLT